MAFLINFSPNLLSDGICVPNVSTTAFPICFTTPGNSLFKTPIITGVDFINPVIKDVAASNNGGNKVLTKPGNSAST